MKLSFMVIVTLLLLVACLVQTSNAQCGLLCALCQLLSVCLLSEPLEINSLTLLTKSLNLQSILTLTALLEIDGDLLCNGTINLLGGVLRVKGAITITPFCIFNVTGNSTIDASFGTLSFPQMTVLFSPSGGKSVLNWLGDANATFSNITSYGQESPKFNFYNGKVLLANAPGATAINMAYASINNAPSMNISGFSIDQLLINTLATPVTLTNSIKNLTLLQATATLGTSLTTMTAIALKQSSSLLINQALTVNSLSTTVTSVLQIASSVSVLSGTLASGTVTVLATGILKLASATLNLLTLNVSPGAVVNCTTGTVVSSSALTISGVSNFLNDATFNGNTVAILGKLFFLDNSSFNNNVIDVLTSGQISVNSNYNTNNNITVETGGNLQVNSGGNLLTTTLSLIGSMGINVGKITQSKLSVSQTGTVSLSNGGSITSSSTVSLLGALTGLSGSLITDSTVDIQSSGTLTLTGGSISKSPLSVLGLLNVNAGSLVSESNVTVQSGATTTLSGGTILNSPLINLIGSVIVNTGSFINGSSLDVKSTGVLNVAGGVLKSSPLSLLGRATLSSASSILSSSISVLSTGVASLAATSTIATSIINISGGQLNLLDTSKLITSTVSIVSSGTLNLTNSAEISGSQSLGITNGKLNLNNGVISGSNVVVSALGSLNMLAGQLTNSPLNIVGGIVNLAAGTITGSSISCNGSLNTSGTISQSPLTLLPNGLLNILNTALISGSSIQSEGTITMNSGSITQSPMTLLGSVFNLVSGSVSGSSIQSNGTITMSSGAINQSPLTLLTNSVLNFVAGTITGSSIQSNGAITMSSGAINQSPLTLLTSSIFNLVNGTITGSSIQSNGTFTMSSGNVNQSPISILTNGLLNIANGNLLGSSVSVLTGAISSITQANIVNSPFVVTGTLNSLLNVVAKATATGVVPIVVNAGGIFNIAGELAIGAIDNLVIGGSSGLLNLAKDAVVTLGKTVDQVSRLDIQINSLGGLLQSIGTIQISTQTNSLSLLSITSQGLLFDGGDIEFINGKLTVTDTLSFVESGLLKINDTLFSLFNPNGDLLVSKVDLFMNGITFHRPSYSLLPSRIIVDGTASLSLTNATVDSTLSYEDDTALTLVYSPESSIDCNGDIINNGSIGSSTYQFICDDKLVVVKFANCSTYQCPGTTLCVESASECPSRNDTCDDNTYGQTHKCWNGQCAASISQCPAFPACPTNTLRCSDGSCSNNCTSNPSALPFNYYGCPVDYYQCGDGTCSKDLATCCVKCDEIPTFSRAVKSAMPFSTARSLILPILSHRGNNNTLRIYGYINVPTNFTSRVAQSYMRIQSLDDSYLDKINGTAIWGHNRTFRDSAVSMIFNITIDGQFKPMNFLKNIDFQFKINPARLNMTGARLAFINTTTNSWELLNHVRPCDSGNGSVCGQTSHFTSFGVLTNFFDDGTDNDDSQSGGGSGISRTTMIIIATTVVGGVVIVGIVVGLVLAKTVKHGSLKYWWASKGGKHSRNVIELR